MRAALVDPVARELVLSADAPDPMPNDRQLLVRVHGAGVNRAALAVIAGKYVVAGGAATAPFVAGGEVAGEVVAVGAAVEGWAPGDRVMAMGRGYAEMT